MKVHLAYSNDWSDGNEYIMGTASEVHTNALFDIYPNDTTITAEFKGNTQQNGTPSPSAPVPVVGVGYLDGAAYKIPVEIGLSTQSIDLSAVQSVRNIGILSLDSDSNILLIGTNTFSIRIAHKARIAPMCTHYIGKAVSSWASLNNGEIITGGDSTVEFRIKDTNYATLEEFQDFLNQEKIANNPVIIYYVLDSAETDVINAPLYKISSYADSISNITLTTSAGAKSFGVDTAVKPSEITLNFKGWHPKDPKESTGGEWG